MYTQACSIESWDEKYNSKKKPFQKVKVSGSKGSYKSVKFLDEAWIVKNLTSKFIEMAEQYDYGIWSCQ